MVNVVIRGLIRRSAAVRAVEVAAASELVTLAGDHDPAPVVQHDEARRRQRRLRRDRAAGPLSGSGEEDRQHRPV